MPDAQSISEQVLPYLFTHTTPTALRLYLQDLIGTSPKAKTLTEQFVADRFPSQGSASAPPAPKQPQTQKPAAVSSQAANVESPRKVAAKPVRLTPSNVTAALAATETTAPRTLPPTQEMKELDTAFSMLSMEPSSSEASAFAPPIRRLCLCQGAKHPLAEHMPLCMACGLILCSALRPVPVSPYSACPSCNAQPIVPPHTRTQLLNQLLEKREQLVQEQQEQEAERKAELARNRYAETPFPTLQGTPAPTEPATTAKRNRVLHLDMKTHKVTVTRRKEKPTAAPKKTPEPSISTEMATTAEDGSALVHNYEDIGFRQRHPEKGALYERAAEQHRAMSTLPPMSYVPVEKRAAPLEPVCSEVDTEVPDLDLLIQARPPGSSADVQRRNKNAAISAGVARAQGRKTGKPSKKR